MIKATKYILSLLIILAFLIPTTVNAETLVGTTVESRLALAFKVNDQAAQALLPDGWKLLTLPRGAFAGANIMVAFIDKHIALDANGKPLTPFSSRAIGLVNYGVKKGVKGARTFITLTYETPPVVNPYGNSVSTNISRSISLNGSFDGIKIHKEMWNIKPESGGEISLDLSCQTGKPGWKSAK